MASTGFAICAGSICIGIVALIILIISSFSLLEVNEVGLDYSGITKTINRDSAGAYTAGIHFLGVGHSFIKYPTTVQTYEFSKGLGSDGPLIKSRTKDGLEVEIEVSFLYVYITNSLYENYMKFGPNYRTPCLKIAIDVLTDTSTLYTADRFFFDKEIISNEMSLVLNETFTLLCYATVEYFLLKNIDLPTDFENAILETETMKLDIHKAEAEKSKMLIELDTKVQLALISSLIKVNKADGWATALLNENKAEAESFYTIMLKLAQALAGVKLLLGLSGTDLVNYMKVKILKEYPQENMVIGLK